MRYTPEYNSTEFLSDTGTHNDAASCVAVVRVPLGKLPMGLPQVCTSITFRGRAGDGQREADHGWKRFFE